MGENQIPYVKIRVYSGGCAIFEDKGRFEINYNTSGKIFSYIDNNGKLHKWYNACVYVETAEEPK